MVNFGTRFETRKGPNSTENSDFSNLFYQINHIPGWLFPVYYQVANGDEMKALIL